MKKQGGRPSLGGDGENRTSVSIVGPDGGRFNLSLLTIQRDFLSTVGGGNRSEGFRRIIRFLSESARLYSWLKYTIESVLDMTAIDPMAHADLVRWLEELDRILEHGRAETETVDGETPASSGQPPEC